MRVTLKMWETTLLSPLTVLASCLERVPGHSTGQEEGMCACVLSRFSRVQLFVTLWTAACQAPLSLGFLQARILEWVAMPSSRRTSKRECFSSSSIYIKRAHEQNGGGGQAESVWWVRALFPQKDIERVISAYPGGFLVPGLLVCRDQVQMFGGFPSKGSKQTRWAGI